MHIGTNDLKNSSPSEISSSISSLGQEIRKEVPNTNLVISEVIIRNDDPSLNAKISDLNKNLAQVCANNNWNFITHKNILPVHLNSYGLHLNKQGSSYSAKNFINFLKSDYFQVSIQQRIATIILVHHRINSMILLFLSLEALK